MFLTDEAMVGILAGDRVPQGLFDRFIGNRDRGIVGLHINRRGFAEPLMGNRPAETVEAGGKSRHLLQCIVLKLCAHQLDAVQLVAVSAAISSSLGRAAGLDESDRIQAMILARSCGFFSPAKFILVPESQLFGLCRKPFSAV